MQQGVVSISQPSAPSGWSHVSGSIHSCGSSTVSSCEASSVVLVSGDTVLVTYSSFGNPGSVTVDDSGSVNSYSSLVSATDGGVYTGTLCSVITSGGTVTVTAHFPSAVSYSFISWDQYSGGTCTKHNSDSNFGSGTAVATGSPFAASSGDLIYCGVALGSSSRTITPSAGYSLRQSDNSADGQMTYDLYPSAATTYDCASTIDVSVGELVVVGMSMAKL